MVSKGGTNQWHGMVSGFHRNSVLDSSDVSKKSAPFLLRWDPSATLGGPILNDRVFIFGSLERIRESRHLNFSFPPNTPDFLQTREQAFDQHNQTYETRGFLKLDEPTRTNSDSRFLMLGFHDTATLGDQSNPSLLSAYLQYRGEPFSERAAHPEASPATTLV